MSNSKILIIGATGFIGKKLVDKMAVDLPQHQLVCWSGAHDISSAAVIGKIVAEKPEIIIMAAGKSYVPESWVNPWEFYHINTTGTINVAEAARVCKARIIFLSTFVYGEPYRLPIKETNAVRPFNPYASSKFAAEQILKDFSRHFGVDVNILRVFNVYGKGQRPEFLIPTLIQQYHTSDVIRVKDLNPKRDYVHVDDLIDALIASTQHFNGFQVYNVAGGESFSVSDIIQILFKAGGRELPVESEGVVRANEVNDTVADISKIKKDLNWSPKIKFEQGIAGLLAE